jgi:serine/threonine-protein kinase
MSSGEHAGNGRAYGRYALFGAIGAGGMATVHFGRLRGQAGFSRHVAIKKLRPHYAGDADFVAMFLDEARLAARIHHPNVVQTLDVLVDEHEILVVMEYVHGESLARIVRALGERGEKVPSAVAAAIVAGALHGLHAAHEARSETGEPLGLVHRDVSPQNILCGPDGSVRVLDFGVAKARGRASFTRDGEVKGKVGYMAPEQLDGSEVSRRADVYSAGVVLWELAAGARLFDDENQITTFARVLEGRFDPPSRVNADVPLPLEAIIMKALSTDPAARFATAREMALAIEAAMPLATTTELGAWVDRAVGESLRVRAGRIGRIEAQEAAAGFSATGGSAVASDALARNTTISYRASFVLETGSEPAAKKDVTPRKAAGPTALAAFLGMLVAFAAVRMGAFSPQDEGATSPARAASAADERATNVVRVDPAQQAELDPAEDSNARVPPSGGPATGDDTVAPENRVEIVELDELHEADGPELSARPKDAAPSAPRNTATGPVRAERLPRPHPPEAPRVVNTAARAPASAACTPPYRIDSNGRKIFKRECL